MSLTTRTCTDCGYKFDILKEKYFWKTIKIKNSIELFIKVIISTVRDKRIFEPKIICEKCNRNNKLKKLGLKE